MPGAPRRILLAAVLLVLATCAAAVWYALSQPSMGMQFAPYTPDGEQTPKQLRITESPPGGPVAGALAVRLQGRHDALDLLPSDLIEEPDFFDTYEEMAQFFARQSRLGAPPAGPAPTPTPPRRTTAPTSTARRCPWIGRGCRTWWWCRASAPSCRCPSTSIGRCSASSGAPIVFA